MSARRPFMSNYRVHEKKAAEAAQIAFPAAYIADLDAFAIFTFIT